MKTLITGAGASMDIHNAFKSGKELLKAILNDVSDLKSGYCEWVLDWKGTESANIDKNRILSFHHHLNLFVNSDSGKSIDQFISEVMHYPEFESHRESFIYIGKFAILYNIHNWEEKYSKIPFEYNWLNKLANHLIAEVRKKNIIQLVTFNYDRMLEFHLSKSLLNEIPKIHHVYGTLYSDPGTFGKLPEVNAIQTKEMGNFLIANDRVKWDNSYQTPNRKGDKVYFMGFGFDDFNCRQIGLQNHTASQLIGNIFTKVEPGGNFTKRRTETDRIGRIIPEIDFTFLSCSEFVDFIFES